MVSGIDTTQCPRRNSLIPNKSPPPKTGRCSRVQRPTFSLHRQARTDANALMPHGRAQEPRISADHLASWQCVLEFFQTCICNRGAINVQSLQAVEVPEFFQARVRELGVDQGQNAQFLESLEVLE